MEHTKGKDMFLVIGATGNIGKHVVAELSSRGLPVRVVSRDIQHARQVLPETVEYMQANLTQEPDVQAALHGVSKIYLATNGPDQLVAETNVINAARNAGVQHVVRVSVIGATPDHFVAIARAHHQLDQLLAESGIPATTLRPNWFMENFFGSADSIVHQGAIYGSADDGRVAFIDSRDTAAVAVRVLTEDGHAGKDYHLTGPEALTFAEAAQRLSEGSGHSVTYINLSDSDFRGALVGAGVPEVFADLYLQINRNARENNLAVVSNTIEAVTGLPARSLAVFTRDNAAAFTPVKA
ncbi:MAG: SDR family oxidoreductase [Roseiflexaceae bacterium]|nr:SDR family oxidoreductase [Roseiflexaceae bacterium]